MQTKIKLVSVLVTVVLSFLSASIVFANETAKAMASEILNQEKIKFKEVVHEFSKLFNSQADQNKFEQQVDALYDRQATLLANSLSLEELKILLNLVKSESGRSIFEKIRSLSPEVSREFEAFRLNYQKSESR